MAQSLARLWTHLIFSTKNRFPFLNDKILRAEMHAYLAEMPRSTTAKRSSSAALKITHTLCSHSLARYL
jgi:hypothetical protein